jgi:8-amino-7-oxononanoate synthase
MSLVQKSEGYNIEPIKKSIDYIHQNGLYRKARVVTRIDETQISIDGKTLINFCSNDYLGLSGHHKIIKAINDSLSKGGIGSGASPLVCGKTHLHDELEKKIAAITGRDRAILFSSGYMANIGVIQALTHAQTFNIYMDRLCHASIVDGVLLSRARFKRFQHASAESLQRLMELAPKGDKLVLTESVYSMDGDMAPLNRLSGLCREYGACLYVDDAHGFGVLGRAGLGALEECGLGQEDVPLLMATFGKALGVQGAFVAGTQELVELMIQRSRSYMYSTSLPIPVVAAMLAAFDVLKDEPERRAHLRKLVEYFQQRTKKLGFQNKDYFSPIQPVIVGDSLSTMKLCDQLERKGILVAGIRQPTVPSGTARLRITFSAAHSFEQVDQLISALESSLPIVTKAK